MTYRYSPRPSDGYERARQHIREAQELSDRLGGTDEDVKEYFFSLPRTEMNDVLNEYELHYGELRRKYAEETLADWRTGRVKMSGMVAARLFDLLPPRMPATKRFRLAENLWRHVGPQSRAAWRVGMDADIESVAGVVHEHFRDVATHYAIPDALERRFTWLAAGDVQVKQQLLNALQDQERELAVAGSRKKMAVLLDHVRGDTAGHTTRLVETLEVGKHELQLCLDRTASGITPMVVADGNARLRNAAVESNGSYGCLLWIGAVAVVSGFLAC